MLFWGIVTGLVAALGQSCSYIASRYFLARAGNAWQLLAASQLWMGLGAGALWLFVGRGYGGEFGSFKVWQAATLACGSFIVGHLGFFMAQRNIESSRIASLLGLKIGFVAILSVLMLGCGLLPLQWLAIAVTVVAAMAMNWSSGKLVWGGMGFLLVALVGYAFSDIGVFLLVGAFETDSKLTGSLLGFCVAYMLLGVVLTPLVPILGVTKRMLLYALPFAICWGVAMIFLYVCFAYLGAAFGNVIQASRGIISLVLGIGLGMLGIPGLEGKHSAAVWVRRGIAALLMFTAITLYALAPENAEEVPPEPIVTLE